MRVIGIVWKKKYSYSLRGLLVENVEMTHTARELTANCLEQLFRFETYVLTVNVHVIVHVSANNINFIKNGYRTEKRMM